MRRKTKHFNKPALEIAFNEMQHDHLYSLLKIALTSNYKLETDEADKLISKHKHYYKELYFDLVP